jgi:hypothetical protein
VQVAPHVGDDAERVAVELLAHKPGGNADCPAYVGRIGRGADGVFDARLSVMAAPAGTARRYLGHKNIQHTVRYTELSPEIGSGNKNLRR